MKKKARPWWGEPFMRFLLRRRFAAIYTGADISLRHVFEVISGFCHVQASCVVQLFCLGIFLLDSLGLVLSKKAHSFLLGEYLHQMCV